MAETSIVIKVENRSSSTFKTIVKKAGEALPNGSMTVNLGNETTGNIKQIVRTTQSLAKTAEKRAA